MKVLLVGGGGYLGRIVRPALEEIHHVTFLDLNPVPDAHDRSFTGDLANDDLVRQATAGQDVIVYMAMGTNDSNKSTYNKIDPAFNVNVRDQYRVLLHGLEQGATRFILASSLSVYIPEDRQTLLDESRPASCFSPYAISKRLAEYLHAAAAQKYPDRTFLSLRLNFPRTEQEFPPYAFNPELGMKNVCGTGPNDTRRLFTAAVAFDRPGYHVIHTSGDLQGIRFSNARANELLGWFPQGN